MIYFCSRKHGSHFDASFFLMDGERASTATVHWHLGDVVGVLFGSLPREIAETINEADFIDSTIIAYKNTTGDGYNISVPCVVVKRRHGVSWADVGHFRNLGMSVTLEAESGLWEDILCWIVLGERPGWADG